MSKIRKFTKIAGPLDWLKKRKQQGPVVPVSGGGFLDHLVSQIDPVLAKAHSSQHDKILKDMTAQYKSVTPQALLQLKMKLKNYKPAANVGEPWHPGKEVNWKG